VALYKTDTVMMLSSNLHIFDEQMKSASKRETTSGVVLVFHFRFLSHVNQLSAQS